ncbi:Serine/threonine-protein phosphatase 2B catalytic subunit [Dictyocoela muelleri]|nr:Serine/threonine-protein phosphatase 2B catalytic subunit [Dictyocoela muelleri]
MKAEKIPQPLHLLPATNIPSSKIIISQDNIIYDHKIIREHFRNRGILSEAQVNWILDKSKEIFVKEPNLLSVDKECFIYGDIHGQYYDLLNILDNEFDSDEELGNDKSCDESLKNRKISEERHNCSLNVKDFFDNNEPEKYNNEPEKYNNEPEKYNNELKNNNTSQIKNSRDRGYLFLGDYVDRGMFSCETYLYLLMLKITYPTRIFMLRGNHETEKMTSYFSFKKECLKKYSQQVYLKFLENFRTLPIAAIVMKKIFCVHGGISPFFTKIENINQINRFIEPEKSGIMTDLLWSDPHPLFEFNFINSFSSNSSRRCSYFYSDRAVEDFLAKNNLWCIVRGHEVQKDGFRIYSHGNYTPIVKRYINKGSNSPSQIEQVEFKGINFVNNDKIELSDENSSSGDSIKEFIEKNKDKIDKIKKELNEEKSINSLNQNSLNQNSLNQNSLNQNSLNQNSLNEDQTNNDQILNDDGSNQNEDGEVLFEGNNNFDTKSFSYEKSISNDKFAISSIEKQNISKKSEILTKPRIFPQIISIFSAPNYCDSYKNFGASLLFDGKDFQITQYAEVDHPYLLPGFIDPINWSFPFIGQKVGLLLEELLQIGDIESISSSTSSTSIENTMSEINDFKNNMELLRATTECIGEIVEEPTPDFQLNSVRNDEISYEESKVLDIKNEIFDIEDLNFKNINPEIDNDVLFNVENELFNDIPPSCVPIRIADKINHQNKVKKQKWRISGFFKNIFNGIIDQIRNLFLS